MREDSFQPDDPSRSYRLYWRLFGGSNGIVFLYLLSVALALTSVTMYMFTGEGTPSKLELLLLVFSFCIFFYLAVGRMGDG